MISTRGRYALRVMLDLAEYGGEDPVPLKDIAARQELSKKYLEIIAREMVAGGLVEAASGKGGGYRLCREPKDYTIAEILEKTEGTMAPVGCLAEGAEACPRAGVCKTLPLWEEYDKLVHDFFSARTLAETAFFHPSHSEILRAAARELL